MIDVSDNNIYRYDLYLNVIHYKFTAITLAGHQIATWKPTYVRIF